MTTNDDIITDVLFAINQLVMDDLLYMVIKGDLELAVNKLIELEGHWLSESHAKIFINHVAEVQKEWQE